MIQPRRLVERFYYEVWNKGDETVANEILDPDFRFRGSLGPGRGGLEPLRVCRRFHSLRRWSHDEEDIKSIFS
jgi:hypothetical protein